MSATRITPKQPTMKHIVIAGGGPIGLLLALLLRQKGVKNLAVADKRLADFSRSGDFSDELFTSFSEILGLPVTPSYKNRIKNAESSLLEYVKMMKITSYKTLLLQGKW